MAARPLGLRRRMLACTATINLASGLNLNTLETDPKFAQDMVVKFGEEKTKLTQNPMMMMGLGPVITKSQLTAKGKNLTLPSTCLTSVQSNHQYGQDDDSEEGRCRYQAPQYTEPCPRYSPTRPFLPRNGSPQRRGPYSTTSSSLIWPWEVQATFQPSIQLELGRARVLSYRR